MLGEAQLHLHSRTQRVLLVLPGGFEPPPPPFFVTAQFLALKTFMLERAESLTGLDDGSEYYSLSRSASSLMLSFAELKFTRLA